MANSTLRVIATLSVCLALGLARAQESASYEADPPDRAARLSFIQGDVSMQPAGEQDWAAAILNRPLTTGDKLWVEQGGRAEIQVGQAVVRLDSATGFSFVNVDNDTIQMRMTAGVISVRVRALAENERIGVDTPNVALSLRRPGSYRVEVNEAGDTSVVKVSEGEAEASGPSQSFIVRDGQVGTFTGTERFTARVDTLGASDEFDSWAQERERRDYLASSRSEYVSPEVTGYQDLEEYGSWSSEPEYGYVWTPSHVGIGWAPYQYGRWVWVSPWGWTWIDDAPWGYAPFHYGRWAHVSNRWCWVPGPRHLRAVYVPAHVGWSSHGSNVSWFPLGPRDVWMPDGRYSRRYVERVNVTNALIVRSIVNAAYEKNRRNASYGNRAVPGAVTAIPRAAFASAEPVGNRRVRVDDQEIARTPANTMAPRIAPVTESRLGGRPRAPVRTAPTTPVNRAEIVREMAGRIARPQVDRHDPPVRPPTAESPAVPPQTQPRVTEQRAWSDRPREVRVAPQQQPTQEIIRRAVERQANREPDVRQRSQRQENQQNQQREVRQQQDRERVQSVIRQVQQRESQPARPRVERSETHKPAATRSATPRTERGGSQRR